MRCLQVQFVYLPERQAYGYQIGFVDRWNPHGSFVPFTEIIDASYPTLSGLQEKIMKKSFSRIAQNRRLRKALEEHDGFFVGSRWVGIGEVPNAVEAWIRYRGHGTPVRVDIYRYNFTEKIDDLCRDNFSTIEEAFEYVDRLMDQSSYYAVRIYEDFRDDNPDSGMPFDT